MSLNQECFVIDLCGVKAAMTVGFASKSAANTAFKLLAKTNIREAIEIKRRETESHAGGLSAIAGVDFKTENRSGYPFSETGCEFVYRFPEVLFG